ncbi:MAG: acetolactate decarboxylase, partial [Planctomycetota bacterium]
MRFGGASLLIAIIASIALGCSWPPDVAPPTQSPPASDALRRDALVQFSLLAALAANDYASGQSLRDVLSGGDFGIGTFHNLDGEMIVLKGRMYQALADGAVRLADLDGTTPFAAVTHFQEDGRIKHLSAASLAHLDEQLDRRLPRPNSPYAIRIDGQFAELTLRSVSPQTPPFRPLVEVVKDQT